MTADRPPPKRPPPEETPLERSSPESVMRRVTAFTTAQLPTPALLPPDAEFRKDQLARPRSGGGVGGGAGGSAAASATASCGGREGGSSGLFGVAFPLSRRRKLSLYLGAFATLLALSFFVDVHRAAIDRHRRPFVQLSMPLAGAGRPGGPGIGDVAAAAAAAAAADPDPAGVAAAPDAGHDPSASATDTDRALAEVGVRPAAGYPSSPVSDAPDSETRIVPRGEALPHENARHSLHEHANLPAGQHSGLRSEAANATEVSGRAFPPAADGERSSGNAISGDAADAAGDSVDRHLEQPALQGRFRDVPGTLHDKNLSPQELKDDVDQLIAHVDEESSLEEQERTSDAGSHHVAGTGGLPGQATPSIGRTDALQLGGGPGAAAFADSATNASGEAGLKPGSDIEINHRQPSSHGPATADTSVGVSTEPPSLNLSADRSSIFAGHAFSFGALAQSRIRRFFGLDTSSLPANASVMAGSSNSSTGVVYDGSSDQRRAYADGTLNTGAEMGDADETGEQRFEKAQRRFQHLLKQDRSIGLMDDADVLVVQALGLQATRGNCEDTNSADGGSLFKSDAEAASNMDVERSDPLWGAWCMFMGTYKSDAMRDYTTMLTLIEAKVDKLSADSGASSSATVAAAGANQSQSQGVGLEHLQSSATNPSSIDDVMSTDTQNLLSRELTQLRAHLPENELRYIGALALQATYGNCAPYGRELAERKSATAIGNFDQSSLPELRVLRETLTGQTADRQQGALWGAWCVLHGKSRATSASELAERTEQLLGQLSKAKRASEGSAESEFGLSKGADTHSPDLFV
jgi:acyl-CoA-binding protein